MTFWEALRQHFGDRQRALALVVGGGVATPFAMVAMARAIEAEKRRKQEAAFRAAVLDVVLQHGPHAAHEKLDQLLVDLRRGAGGTVFCDFCTCLDCQTGDIGLGATLSHAPTADGRWICSVCYRYSVCVRAKRKAKGWGGPCKRERCQHRPRLAGPWERRAP